MSQFVFYLPNEQWLPLPQRPCLMASDMMESPIPSQIKWDKDRVTVTLLQHEACRVHALVSTPIGATVLLPTVWLFPQWRPYRLELEIVRGLISRLRRGIEVWHSNGLMIPDCLPADLRQLTHQFLKCWRKQEREECSDLLWPLLQQGHQLLALLPQALAKTQGTDLFRPASDSTSENDYSVNSPPSPGTKFGTGLRVDLEDLGIATSELATAPRRRFFSFPSFARKPKSLAPAEELLVESSDNRSRLSQLWACPHLKWIELGLEWKKSIHLESDSKESFALSNVLSEIREQGRRTIWGPFLSLYESCLPDGIKVGNDGSQVCQAFSAELARQLPFWAAQVDMLHVVSGLNGVGVAGLTPTIQYNLVRSALETVARVAPQLPTMISFSQPLGERLAWSVGGQHPDQFLGKLAKEHVPIQVLGLELDLGYFPTGTLPRDPLQWVMELQRWAVWGVPVLVFLRVPSRPSSDPKRLTFAPGLHASPTEDSQRDFIVEFARLLSALPWIHGVVYNQWSDHGTRFGDSGLMTHDGQPKQFLREWLGQSPDQES